MTDEINGHPVKDGWLIRYDRSQGKWVRRMPVAEWQARKRSIAHIKAAKSPEEKRRLLAQGQKAARIRRRKWAKDL